MNLLLSLLVCGASYSSSFGDTEKPLPWNVRFSYTKTNVEVPNDYKFFVTVIYSDTNVSSNQDRYLRTWLYQHPALTELRKKTNFKETHVNDPIYGSYLRSALPVLPAILITLPADRSYFGKAVYCAYGEYIPTNPNTLALEIQTSLQQYSRSESMRYQEIVRQNEFTQQNLRRVQSHISAVDNREQVYSQQYEPYQPYQPDDSNWQNQPLPVIRPEVEELLGSSLDIDHLILIFGVVAVLYLVLNKRRL